MEVQAAQFINVFFVLFILVASEINAQLTIETEKEIWLLAKKRNSINCTVKWQRKPPVQLYWTRNSLRLTKDSKFEEVKVNDTYQLVFKNSSVDESGKYICHAKDSFHTANSTVHVHIGEKPQGVSFKCLYNAKENKVWLFPISTSKNDKINNSKFCQSSTANQWCSSQSASWAEASCSKFNETTQGCAIKKIDKHAIYITQTTLENDFGQSVFRHTLENPRQKCMSDRRARMKVKVIDLDGVSSFFVSWHFPYGDEFTISKISVTSSDDPKQVIKPITNIQKCNGRLSQCTQNIPGKNLQPCTNYTICVSNSMFFATKGPTTACVTKPTKNNAMPVLSHIRVIENKVTKMLEFDWQDPKWYEKGPFFYEYNLVIEGSPSKNRNGVIHGKVKLMIPKMTETRGVFTVSKCTLCGCGEKTVKAFHLQEQPRPSSAKRQLDSGDGNVSIPLVSAVGGLIGLIAGIIIFVMWRRRRADRVRRDEDGEGEPQEMDPEVQPMNPVHHYDEVEEPEHYTSLPNQRGSLSPTGDSGQAACSSIQTGT